MVFNVYVYINISVSVININMESFNLPIHYIDDKYEVDKHIVSDLEILNTNSNDVKPLYHYLFNPNNTFSQNNLSLWSKHYTTNKRFLKDSQKLLSIHNQSKEFDYLQIETIWNNINTETGFTEKYNYMDWFWLKDLNNNSLFLQLWSIYNMASPFLSLAIPILFLILPFFILKIQGIPITITAYINLLSTMFQKHHFGKLFSITSVSWDKQVYIIVSFVFYILQIYHNIVSCIKFIKNMSVIHNELNIVQSYLKHTISNMDIFEKNTSTLSSYKLFTNNLSLHKNILIDINNEIEKIHSYYFNIERIRDIGHVMKIFYQLYNLPSYKLSLEYSFGFNGYIGNLDSIKDSIQLKKINYCKFSKKNTKFINAYYPTIKNPIKNSYNLNKHILITGPNAAGKTTLLKTTIFNILISQQLGVGFYDSATIPIYNKIHCYINIPDTSSRDSLFQAEARRCKNILDSIESNNTKQQHLCVFDELFSGTNPYEAISSAFAFLQYLSKYKNINIILTTHFLELCKRIQNNTCFINNHMNINNINSDMKYTYLLKPGISQIKGGVKVLKDLDYPLKIINDTKNIINNLKI